MFPGTVRLRVTQPQLSALRVAIALASLPVLATRVLMLAWYVCDLLRVPLLNWTSTAMSHGLTFVVLSRFLVVAAGVCSNYLCVSLVSTICFFVLSMRF